MIATPDSGGSQESSFGWHLSINDTVAKWINCLITCSSVHNHVDDVEKITNVVDGEP